MMGVVVEVVGVVLEVMGVVVVVVGNGGCNEKQQRQQQLEQKQ